MDLHFEEGLTKFNTVDFEGIASFHYIMCCCIQDFVSAMLHRRSMQSSPGWIAFKGQTVCLVQTYLAMMTDHPDQVHGYAAWLLTKCPVTIQHML